MKKSDISNISNAESVERAEESVRSSVQPSGKFGEKADRLFGADPVGLDESARGIAVLVIVGVAVGLLSGMFGIGGGTVIVPRAGMARLDATQCGGDVNACDRTDLDFRRHFVRDLRKRGLARRAAAVLRHVRRRADWQLVAFAIAGTRIAVDFRSVPRVCGVEPDKFRAVARPAHYDERADRSLPGAAGRGDWHLGGTAGDWRRGARRARTVDAVQRF